MNRKLRDAFEQGVNEAPPVVEKIKLSDIVSAVMDDFTASAGFSTIRVSNKFIVCKLDSDIYIAVRDKGRGTFDVRIKDKPGSLVLEPLSAQDTLKSLGRFYGTHKRSPVGPNPRGH